jgi:dinuclear metal center YbgI/SA1388 family protein
VPTLAEVVDVLDRCYPRDAAAEWDAVGPVVGDPSAAVSTVLFAVDPVDTVVDQACALGAQLLVTHHPLYLRGTSTVYAGTAKGRLVQRLVTAGCALYVAHTNADDAPAGVSDTLAAVIGVGDAEPLVPSPGRPGWGTGRVGDLASPTTLGRFAVHVADVLPATAVGLRVAGDLDRPVQRVAVCGGAGDAFLDQAAAAGADVYVTADLRHHYTTEHLARGGPALVDPGHWATEWPWLERAGQWLSAAFAGADGESTVVVHVSEAVTDPWTAHVTRETR